MDGAAGSKLEDENEDLRRQLSAANRDIARLLGVNEQLEKQLKTASQRLAQKDATIAQLEAVLDGDDDVQREELPFNARQDLGVRGCA